MIITQELKDWWFNIFDHLFEMFPNGGVIYAARKLNNEGNPPISVCLADDVEDLCELMLLYLLEKYNEDPLLAEKFLHLLR